jgi:hypothetical protein
MTPGRDLAGIPKVSRFLPGHLSAPVKAIVAAGLCLCLAACADFPEVAQMDGPVGPPPTLQPLDGLLPEADVTTDPALALAARAAALQSRASVIGAP